MENVTKCQKIERYSKMYEIKHTFDAPSGVGVKSSSISNNESRGVGSERRFKRNTSNVMTEITNLGDVTTEKIKY